MRGIWLKRGFDFTVAALVLAILAVPLALIGLMVRLLLGAPIFFRQQRPGLHGKPFGLIKFRTMRDIRDLNGELIDDERRLTTFGKFLRAASIDELPELWNVLRGDMSLVGPRPLLMEYLGRYSPEQARRHDVQPGITGWAQVNGRNCVNWSERLKMDVWYVDNHSLSLDLKIIFLTVKTVLSSEGVHAPGHVTMPKFEGTHEV